MSDEFANYDLAPSNPAERAADITPHITNAIDPVPRAIFVGTGGNITCRLKDSPADVIFKNVPNGALLPIRPLYIRAAGTTAADLVGLY